MDSESLSSWKENFFIYKENLSVYYIISIFLSFLSVIVTWLYHRYNLQRALIERSNLAVCEDKAPPLDDDKVNEDVLIRAVNDDVSGDSRTSDEVPNEEILNQIKLAKQSQNATASQIITSRLTEEQLKEEKEVENQQLAEIFKLLQKQQEKFNVSSIEELEDQMKLYR